MVLIVNDLKDICTSGHEFPFQNYSLSKYPQTFPFKTRTLDRQDMTSLHEFKLSIIFVVETEKATIKFLL